MAELNNPLEIYRKMPRTNCGECAVPTCLAFSAGVVKGEKKLSDCPYIDKSFIDCTVAPRGSYEKQLEETLAVLREKMADVDLSASTQRLGARFVGSKLVIKSLGKDFIVDGNGSVTSECHTHAGLTIPLLSYIVHGKGVEPTGTWVSFRELKNGQAMSALFMKRGEANLKRLADDHTDLFEILVDMFSGRRADDQFDADISVILYPLPRMPVLICYWKAEEDLVSKLNIFFDSSAEEHLPIDYIFSLAVGLVMMFEKIAVKHG